MSSKPINTRMTIVIVFAFLLIVALFMRPGGTAETATEQLADVAREVAPKPVAPTVKPSPDARLRAWYAADPTPAAPDGGPAMPPAAAADPGVPAGDPPQVAPNPPPQGPDFPNH